MDKIGTLYIDVDRIDAVFLDLDNEVKCLIKGRIEAVILGHGRWELREVVDKIRKIKSCVSNEDRLQEEIELAMDEWEVCVRTQNVLKTLVPEFNLKTVQDLINLGQRKLLATPHFGRKSLNELMEVIEDKYDIRIQ